MKDEDDQTNFARCCEQDRTNSLLELQAFAEDDDPLRSQVEYYNTSDNSQHLHHLRHQAHLNSSSEV